MASQQKEEVEEERREQQLLLLTGGCHCGQVRFSCRVPRGQPILECNCSICAMVGFLHVIVGADGFTLESPADASALAEYRFNTGTARHLFCPRCGVKSYYRPRSHPEGYSVNARCLDDGMPPGSEIRQFDGRDWERNVASIQTEGPQGT